MTTARVDRAALVRRAMVELVAERGIHGTSMSQVAERAGVATGTAYVHFESKRELLIAAFVEVKIALGEAALAGVDPTLEPRPLFEVVWRNSHDQIAADPAIAHFLLQVEASPLSVDAHAALRENDRLAKLAQELSAVLVDLPSQVLYDLALAPVIRLVASGTELTDTEIDTLIDSCWRAVCRPDSRSSRPI